MIVIFWILLILCAIGVVVPDTAWPQINRGRFVVCLILIAIIGYKVFGSPAH